MRNKVFLFIICLGIASSSFSQERDPNFGINGFVKENIEGYERGLDVFIQEDNKIITIGETAAHPTFADDFVAIIRYEYNGDLDTTFGDSGIVKLSAFNYSQTFYYDAEFQADQKLVLGGQYSTNRFFLRFNTDGSLDTTFANEGITPILEEDYYRDYYFLELTSDDSIMLLRRFQENYLDSNAYAIYRYSPDGHLDSLFGTNGHVDIELDSLHNYFLVDFRILDNGKMLINGKRNGQDEWGTETSEHILMQLLSDGSRDSTFGIDGIATSNVLALSDMEVHSNGKIVCVGTTGLNQQGTQGFMSICRFNEDGSVDSTFSGDGCASLSIDVYADYANAVSIQANGKILVGGSYFNFSGGSVTDCVIVRYNVDGNLDSTFSEDGIFKNGLSSGTDVITEMALQGSNKVVYVGYANYSSFDIITGRLNTDDLIVSPDTLICLGDTASLFAYSDSLILGWAIDTLPGVLISMDPQLQVAPTQESTYLAYTAYDTAYVNIGFIDPPLVNLLSDTVLCENEELILNAFYPGAQYLWQDSSTASYFYPTITGTYFVQVSNACNTVFDTTDVIFNPLPYVDLGPDQTICENDSIILNAYLEDASYLWQDSSINATYQVNLDGVYWVESNLNNCVYRDSINIDLLFNSFSYLELTTCDSLVSPSANYTWFESGIYNDTLVNAMNCDSIISIDLSIESIDPTVILEGITLTAMDEEVSYQWLDCLNNNEEIPGETEQSFTPTQNGSYAVLLTSPLCSEISECIDINSLNLGDLNNNEFTIYPNPTKDIIYIEKISSEEVQIILRDNQGRILISKTTSDIKTSIDLSQYSEGVYHITIQQGDFLHRKSIMKLQ